VGICTPSSPAAGMHTVDETHCSSGASQRQRQE
jgi:hypothetical protein